MDRLESSVIEKTADYAKASLSGEGSGHDWWHVYRVWQLAKHINQTEKGNRFIVELAALLHDVSDWKANNDDSEATRKVVSSWLESLDVDRRMVEEIVEIILTLSFKGAEKEKDMRTIEGKIVRDADRLDGIGAIGIARTFAYGGSKGREMYNPEKTAVNLSGEGYKRIALDPNNKTPTINHFYDKLLLLKDLLLTQTGKNMAEGRHKFMEQFLEEFYKEWDGKL